MGRRKAGARPRVAVALLFAVLGVLGLGACAPADAPPSGSGGSAEGTIRIVDASGRTVHLDRPAERIVSLVPSATSTLHALGAADRLVGRTDYDRAPWLDGVPSVGGGLGPDLETLLTLHPDLVLRFAGEQDVRTPARLDDLGIPHLGLRPDALEDVFRTIEILGLATGLEEAADTLRRSIERGLAEVRARVRTLPRRRVAYVLGGDPPWVAGPGTYIHDLVELAGGENVFGDLHALYAATSPEQIRSRRIDVVLLGGPAAFDRALAPAAVVRRVEVEVEIPGPDMVEAARHLAELIHGPLPERADPEPDASDRPSSGAP